MPRHISFPSIEQFRNVVKNVDHRFRYRGKDETGAPIYDRLAVAPTLNFEGTIKLHGTNAGVCFSPAHEMWVQSRENIITPEKDNAGFALFVHANKATMEHLYNAIRATYDVEKDDNVLIFGEWCGGNIQKGVGISQIPKTFVIFGICLVSTVEGFEASRFWVNLHRMKHMYDQFRPFRWIHEFPTYNIDIDFGNSHLSVDKLNELTLAVEDCCPVAQQLGATPEAGSMIGEGIVWKCTDPDYIDSGYWFKVKGVKHSATKVKTLVQVDVEKINNIRELVERLTPEWRLEQMFQKTFDTLNGGWPDIKKLGDFIKNTMSDIIKEELDTMAASGYGPKDIGGEVAKKVKAYFAAHQDDKP